MTTLRLFITESSLPATAATEVEWRTLTGLQVGHGRSALGKLPAASRIELFLPPARVLRASVTLPVGSKRQAGKLLPYALDQVLLAEPSEQHLAHKLLDEQCRVAAIQRDVFAELLNTLTQVGRRPRAVWSADALIPADGEVLFWYGDGWARRTADAAQWFDATSPALVPDLLKLALTDCPALTLALPSQLLGQVDLDQWQLQLGCPVKIQAGDPLAQTVAPDAIDLLQGEFAAGPQIDLDLSRLKPSAMLAGAALALLCTVWLGQWWSWRSEEKALKQQINTAFSQAFPGTPIVDPLLQLQTKLGTGKPAATAPNANDSLNKLLALAPNFQGGSLKLVNLDYLNGRIEAEYLAKPEQLTTLSQTLSTLGKVDTRPTAPDRTRLILTPNP